MDVCKVRMSDISRLFMLLNFLYNMLEKIAFIMNKHNLEIKSKFAQKYKFIQDLVQILYCVCMCVYII